MSNDSTRKRKPIIWIIVGLLIVLAILVSVRAWIGTAEPEAVGVNEGPPGRDGDSL